MESKIKLICIDMDGTLLNSKHEVSDENKKAIKKAHDRGVNIALCTGRMFLSAKYYANLIGINTPIIASNGAFIKNGYNDKAIYENPLPKDIAIEIYKIAKKYRLTIQFNSWNVLFMETPASEEHAYVVMNRDLPKEKRVKFIINEKLDEAIQNYEGNILKAGVIEKAANKDKLWTAKEEIKDIFRDKLHVVSSGDNNFEITVGSVSKGNATAYLANMLNIPQEEVMCIGDSENDLSMIKYAGIGVAMGNGLDIVKEAADFITDTNDNSGVSKAIERFVLKY
ncbi:Cof-type HAD-IIB family hydrolase [Clostridium isatidis]|uniref:HAD family hydrolase n=1 Tax=Clostridium isatidis TaxID=182773 RepID=A0A343JA58_9CLOT|nr:Cof-type HAD-IIB family hydrolase [Clostridium isatidis]ASW42416.1 HAD family hydrolase [Clostridium isatidis]